MPLNEPSWWYLKHTKSARAPWQARLLTPIAKFYAAIANRRLTKVPAYIADRPVICIGNFTAGGTGKTPLTLWIAQCLQRDGLTPVILSRGYGGRLDGPVWVDPDHHTADEVGDEPLMMASVCRVMVARKRPAGARAIQQASAKADVILLDDGLQNPSLKKSLTIAVIDAARGLGNGWVIPAGPLRASLSAQLAVTDAVVVNHAAARSDDKAKNNALGDDLSAQGFKGPVLPASLTATGDVGWLKGARLLAFAGIGNPNRFFETLRHHGADVVVGKTFADHQPIGSASAAMLLNEAAAANLQIVTTDKDFARLKGDASSHVRKLRETVRTVGVQFQFEPDQKTALEQLIRQVLKPKVTTN